MQRGACPLPKINPIMANISRLLTAFAFAPANSMKVLNETQFDAAFDAYLAKHRITPKQVQAWAVDYETFLNENSTFPRDPERTRIMTRFLPY